MKLMKFFNFENGQLSENIFKNIEKRHQSSTILIVAIFFAYYNRWIEILIKIKPEKALEVK